MGWEGKGKKRGARRKVSSSFSSSMIRESSYSPSRLQKYRGIRCDQFCSLRRKIRSKRLTVSSKNFTLWREKPDSHDDDLGFLADELSDDLAWNGAFEELSRLNTRRQEWKKASVRRIGGRVDFCGFCGKLTEFAARVTFFLVSLMTFPSKPMARTSRTASLSSRVELVPPETKTKGPVSSRSLST